MRLLLGTLTVLVLASGCADGQTSGSAADPVRAGAEPEVVALLSATAAGGRPGAGPTHLRGPGDVAALVADLRGPLVGEVRRAVEGADVPQGSELVGGVVAVGCEPAEDVAVEGAGEGLRLTAAPAPATGRECLAPVTTVALVLVEEPTDR
ncbi:hypothetical protein [Nocardioides sp. Leaf374]|uniref:hypothetical protein n=1 Tax=Nocardioides sp. Leaf374 TaxID=2876560 RepID=UPI001E2C2D59|nr:hypothetical protein [Nocardioides sp. Leaf374]